MKLLILSDVHTEFRPSVINVPEEVDAVILAGDIGVIGNAALTAFLSRICTCGKPVLYVLGNHEYYGWESETAARAALQQTIAEYPNLHILDNNDIVIDDVHFIGTTLYTNFGNDPIATVRAKYDINDFTNGPFSPQDYVAKFGIAERFIASNLDHNRKNVVITHWPPLVLLKNPRYPDYNPYFNNDMNRIFNLPINLWVYGHNHHSEDLNVNNIRFVSNQLGYPKERFAPTLKVIDI